MWLIIIWLIVGIGVVIILCSGKKKKPVYMNLRHRKLSHEEYVKVRKKEVSKDINKALNSWARSKGLKYKPKK